MKYKIVRNAATHIRLCIVPLLCESPGTGRTTSLATICLALRFAPRESPLLHSKRQKLPLSTMLIRLVFIAVSAIILGTRHHAEAYTWPAIRYSPPNSCGKNETFDQNSFVCIRCGRAERPKDKTEGELVLCRSLIGSFYSEHATVL